MIWKHKLGVHDGFSTLFFTSNLLWFDTCGLFQCLDEHFAVLSATWMMQGAADLYLSVLLS
jgi:hypothetical protein